MGELKKKKKKTKEFYIHTQCIHNVYIYLVHIQWKNNKKKNKKKTEELKVEIIINDIKYTAIFDKQNGYSVVCCPTNIATEVMYSFVWFLLFFAIFFEREKKY